MPPEKKTIPKQPEVNIGTAGHVDHGKTTIVEAITGVWTSAHSEELRRGITIRVGYADAAFYKCPNCPPPECYSTSPKCPNCGSETQLLRVASFVDCPGHESLMANMLSGAAVMDGAILVVAANEKIPQPQTREHLLALQMLGMKQLVIAQNKVDLLDDEQSFASLKEVKKFTENTIAQEAPIIPLSAQHRINLDALIQAVEEHIKTPQRKPNAPPLMQILRSFDVNRPGFRVQDLKGGIVGGTITEGELKTGMEVEIRPGIPDEKSSKYVPIRTHISSLGTGAGIVEKVNSGGLVAVGTTLDPAITKSDGLLGSVLGLPESLPPVLSSVTLETDLFEMAVGAPDMVKVEKIKVNESLRLNVGTSVTLGAVSSARDDKIELKLRRPICCVAESRAAISRRIGDRWRLIGSGKVR
ncbi:MAG: translation initiation factor IF-2 subunit gamma [Thaumarchaeota archaeon]|nr:translation initiation factor IF-2 subunit gamma [Nitrososphaerota archaeon]